MSGLLNIFWLKRQKKLCIKSLCASSLQSTAAHTRIYPGCGGKCISRPIGSGVFVIIADEMLCRRLPADCSKQDKQPASIYWTEQLQTSSPGNNRSNCKNCITMGWPREEHYSLCLPVLGTLVSACLTCWILLLSDLNLWCTLWIISRLGENWFVQEILQWQCRCSVVSILRQWGIVTWWCKMMKLLNYTWLFAMYGKCMVFDSQNLPRTSPMKRLVDNTYRALGRTPWVWPAGSGCRPSPPGTRCAPADSPGYRSSRADTHLQPGNKYF